MNKTLIANEAHGTMGKTHPFWMRLFTAINGKNNEHPSTKRHGMIAFMVEIASGSDSKIASERAEITARKILK